MSSIVLTPKSLMSLGVKEMRHDRFHNRLAAVVRFHSHDAAKDLKRFSVPVFEDVVVCGKTGIDEGTQILADGLASMPVSNTEVTDSVLGKAIVNSCGSYSVTQPGGYNFANLVHDYTLHFLGEPFLDVEEGKPFGERHQVALRCLHESVCGNV
jgi:hypothetical protein